MTHLIPPDGMPIARTTLRLVYDQGEWRATLQEDDRIDITIRRGTYRECADQANRTGAFLIRSGWRDVGPDELPFPSCPARDAPPACSLATAVFG